MKLKMKRGNCKSNLPNLKKQCLRFIMMRSTPRSHSLLIHLLRRSSRFVRTLATSCSPREFELFLKDAENVRPRVLPIK
ncbi:unnamed protein product, partial [Nesidiocoris tenuis]